MVKRISKFTGLLVVILSGILLFGFLCERLATVTNAIGENQPNNILEVVLGFAIICVILLCVEVLTVIGIALYKLWVFTNRGN